MRWKGLEVAEVHNRLGIQIVELGHYRCFRGYIPVQPNDCIRVRQFGLDNNRLKRLVRLVDDQVRTHIYNVAGIILLLEQRGNPERARAQGSDGLQRPSSSGVSST